MSQISELANFLNEIIPLEKKEPLYKLGGYIVGELIGDYEDKYTNLYENNPTVQKIGDLASDLEISNGNPEELWEEIKRLSKELSKSI